MDHTNETTAATDAGVGREARRAGWFAAGGAMGAIVVSSCCSLPLVLVTTTDSICAASTNAGFAASFRS